MQTTSPSSCSTCKAARITTTSITGTTLSVVAWSSTLDVLAGLQILPSRSLSHPSLKLLVKKFDSFELQITSKTVYPCILKYNPNSLKRAILFAFQVAPWSKSLHTLQTISIISWRSLWCTWAVWDPSSAWALDSQPPPTQPWRPPSAWVVSPGTTQFGTFDQVRSLLVLSITSK